MQMTMAKGESCGAFRAMERMKSRSHRMYVAFLGDIVNIGRKRKGKQVVKPPYNYVQS